MDNLPVPIGGGADLPVASFEAAIVPGSAAAFRRASKAPATQRAYLADWQDFATWCRAESRAAMPAGDDTVSDYLAALARRGLAVSTIDRRAAAIAFVHRASNTDSPIGHESVRAVLQGIRKTLGRRPDKKQALTVDLVVKVVRRIKQDLAGRRDRALILLCFAAALRRSELVALDVADIEHQRRGIVVRIVRSKADQESAGAAVGIPNGKLKVGEAIEAWREAAGIVAGPLFRGVDRGVVSAERLSDRQFARILKARCASAGLDPDRFGGHSPRSGFATSAGDLDADLRRTADHLRHARLETTRGYIQDGELFRDHAGKGFL